ETMRMQGRVAGLMLGVVALMAWGCDDGDANPPPTVDMQVEGDMRVGQVDMGDAADLGAEPDAAVGTGNLVADGTFIDFGTAGLNQRVEQDLVLTNDGDGDLTVIALEGLEGGFSTSRQAPIRIPAGANRTLVLEFRPEVAGRANATLILQTDIQGAAPIEVQLVGIGGEPVGMLVTDVIDFGSIAPGMPAAEFIRVVSEGPIPLTVRAVDGVMPPFSIPDGQLPAVAEGDLDASVLVQFQPEGEGEFEQMVLVRTDAGDWPATLRGRAVSVGDLVVEGVDPAWGPNDAPVVLTIHGGPFMGEPNRILVGETPLVDPVRVDVDRVRGTLMPGGDVTLTDADQLDVRVEIGGSFGLRPRAFIRTGPVDSGQLVDDAALAAGTLDASGNPWRFERDSIPADVELSVASGTVVLIATDATIDVEGVLRTGGDEGLNVFSNVSRTPGAWRGFNFIGEADSQLSGTVLEYAGDGGVAAVTTANATTFTDLRVRHSLGHGIEVAEAGTLVLLGGQFTDIQGDAIRLLTAGSWFRLSDTYIRRVDWPISASPIHFGVRPLGLGNDWARTSNVGIGIGGDIEGDVVLGNQPVGIEYGLREDLVVLGGASLTLGAASPLRLNGRLSVLGRLTLPGGLRLQAYEGGVLHVAATGTLQAPGTPAEPITIEGRPVDGPAAPGSWRGVEVDAGATLEITRLILRDAGAAQPALHIFGDVDAINGLRIEDSQSASLRLGGDAEITTLEVSGGQGIMIDAGAGSLAGVCADAVLFGEQDLCAAWDLAELRTADGALAETNCE
ncbi:MAG: hypothetical protein ACI9U2_004801, partial [Bradymonadia bacterium]